MSVDLLARDAVKDILRGWGNVCQHMRDGRWLTKEHAPCCVSKRDALGRLPIGFCSPSCLRRPR